MWPVFVISPLHAYPLADVTLSLSVELFQKQVRQDLLVIERRIMFNEGWRQVSSRPIQLSLWWEIYCLSGSESSSSVVQRWVSTDFPLRRCLFFVAERGLGQLNHVRTKTSWNTISDREAGSESQQARVLNSRVSAVRERTT